MKDLFKYTKTDKIIKGCILLSSFFLLIDIIGIIIVFVSLPPFVPLFNQLPWGDARLGTRIELFIPVLIVFSFLIGNLLLLNKLYEKSPLIARMLAVTTLLLAILATIFIVQTIRIIR